MSSSSDGTVRCNECGNSYSTAAHLKQHVKAKHQGAKWCCQVSLLVACVWQRAVDSSLVFLWLHRLRVAQRCTATRQHCGGTCARATKVGASRVQVCGRSSSLYDRACDVLLLASEAETRQQLAILLTEHLQLLVVKSRTSSDRTCCDTTALRTSSNALCARWLAARTSLLFSTTCVAIRVKRTPTLLPVARSSSARRSPSNVAPASCRPQQRAASVVVPNANESLQRPQL